MAKGRKVGSKNFLSNNIQAVYLYADGHAAVVKKDYFKGIPVEWVELHQKLGPECEFSGHIVLNNFYSEDHKTLSLIKKAKLLSISEYSTRRFSEKGINPGIKLKIVGQDYSVDLLKIPDLFYGDFTHNEEADESWEEVCNSSTWRGYNVIEKFFVEE